MKKEKKNSAIKFFHSRENRVWEVDFARGLMILFVIWDHLMFDVSVFCSHAQTAFGQWLYNIQLNYSSDRTVFGGLENVTHYAFVMSFVFLSGVSSSFSNSNGQRGLKLAAFAILFTAATYAASTIVHMDCLISFNVIHVLALSILLYTVIDYIRGKLTKNWQLNVYGWLYFLIVLASLVIGYYFRSYPADNAGIFVFMVQNMGVAEYSPADFLAFLPSFGWFLTGAFLGKKLYPERKTLFPAVDARFVEPLTFCGRHSLLIYFGSQLFLYGLFYLLSLVGGI